MDIGVAYFGAGCFWHSELVFSKIEGVTETEVGFCKPQDTGKDKQSRVEVVRVTFNSSMTTFEKLIKTFWETHNPANPVNLNPQNIER